ncbi:MAG: AbrB family transcriptional regulator, partial [Pseudomonadota bacterium]
MIGAMLATTLVALGKVEVAGRGVKLPMSVRMVMVPVIGVMLGSSFTPEVARQIPGWWITVVGLVVFIVVTIAIVYQINRRIFGFDRPTAYFSAIPGGVIESAIIGEQAGGDPRTISLIHFCRIVLAVLSIPIAMRLIYGPVGSVAISPEKLDTALGTMDIGLLVGAGVVGLFVAKKLNVPGAPITGPMVMSALVHVTGWTAAHPPSLLVIIAQIVMGASLGSRFAGYAFRDAILALKAAFGGMVVMLSLAVALSAALLPFVSESYTSLILAFAPGGLAEMSLIALSLNIGVAFVAAHHVARIFIAMVGAPILYRLIVDRDARV